eukprot:110117_1
MANNSESPFQWTVSRHDLVNQTEEPLFRCAQFISCKTKWQLLCFQDEETDEWQICLKCIAAKKQIGVNFIITFTDMNNRWIDYAVIAAEIFQTNIMSRYWSASCLSSLQTIREQLQITCVIQETMKLQKNVFTWTISDYILKMFQTTGEHNIFCSPPCVINGATWYISCSQRLQKGCFHGCMVYESNTNAMVNIKIEILPFGKSFEDESVFMHDKEPKSYQLFRLDEIKHLKSITIKCTINYIHQSINRPIWTVSAELLRQFKRADFEQTFLSPKIIMDDAEWCIELTPKLSKRGQECSLISIRCVSVDSYMNDTLIYSKIECKQLNHLDINVAEWVTVRSKGITREICNFADFQELDELKIHCQIESDRKIWKIPRRLAQSNGCEFKMHQIGWKLETIQDKVKLDLIQFPNLKKRIGVRIWIYCNYILCGSVIRQYERNKENIAYIVPINYEEFDDEKKEIEEKEVVFM